MASQVFQVILHMNVHCDGCAGKIRQTAKSVPGVEDVWTSPETAVVVVTGTADAEALRSRIEHVTQRPVAVLSDGAEEARLAAWKLLDTWRRTYTAAPSRRRALPLETPPDHRWMLPSPNTTTTPPPYVGAGRVAPPPQHYDRWHSQPAYPYDHHGPWHGGREFM